MRVPARKCVFSKTVKTLARFFPPLAINKLGFKKIGLPGIPLGQSKGVGPVLTTESCLQFLQANDTPFQIDSIIIPSSSRPFCSMPEVLVVKNEDGDQLCQWRWLALTPVALSVLLFSCWVATAVLSDC